MALANGDYVEVEQKLVETILADAGPGGLCENGALAVKSAVARDNNVVGALARADFPAILVRARTKTETRTGPAYALVKTFRVRLSVVVKDRDRDLVEGRARRIASRLEELVREQTRSDRQFMGLPDLIGGAEGALCADPVETSFAETAANSDGVMAVATVDAEIVVPCAFRYE